MILDTNIVISYLDGESSIVEACSAWKMKGGYLYLSSIVEAELLSFPKLSLYQIEIMTLFLEENFIPVSFDRQIAHIAGEIRRTQKIKLPDAAIAATALFLKVPLMTKNYSDFEKIMRLQLIKA